MIFFNLNDVKLIFYNYIIENKKNIKMAITKLWFLFYEK